MTGRERLRAWIDRSRLNQSEAADLLGFDRTFLSQILTGRRTPGLANGVRIEDITGIPVRAWAASSEAETGSVLVGVTRKSKCGKV